MGRKVILDDAEQGAPTQDPSAPTGSINEVEEAIAVDENEIGTNSQRPRTKDETEDVEMLDNDAPGADMDIEVEVDVPVKRSPTASPSPTPRKRRRSGNSKPSITEENDSSPDRPVLTRHRTRSHVEVVVPPRPDYASPRKENTSTKVKKTASHKLVAPESPVSTRRSSPVKVKTPARKSVTAVEEKEEEEEEEEPAPTKRAPPKKTQKRKRDESESEEEHKRREKPTPGPSKPKPTQAMRTTQRPAQGSSPPPAGPGDAPLRGRRSAAQRADEKLKDIMPDVINFQKQMKRGTVVGEWEKSTKEQEKADKKTKEEKSKENARDKMEETTKRRRSDIRYDSWSTSSANRGLLLRS